MKAKNGQTYLHNYARAAAYFLGTCAQEPDTEERKAAYKCITDFYKVFQDNIDAVGYKTSPDVYFEPWEKQNGREKDIAFIRGAIDKIEALIKEFYDIIIIGSKTDGGFLLPPNLKPSRTLSKVLTAINISQVKSGEGILLCLTEKQINGLSELAHISGRNIIHITDGPKEDKAYLYFSRCVFEPDNNWTAQAFDAVLGANGVLIRLCNMLKESGYRRVDCRDGKKVSLDYVKLCGKKEEPLKAAWAERNHVGIEISFEELRLLPCFIWVRMPSFPYVLENTDKLPERARSFISQHTKTCDGCRFCVQTDKTGTKPLAGIRVDGIKKCPRFPGFTMNWRALNRQLAEDIFFLAEEVDKLMHNA